MNIENNKILINVPITGATSKIRVKRREDNFGNPIATSSNKFTKQDYIEWQISYFLPLESIWDKYRKSKNMGERKEAIKEIFEYKDPKLISIIFEFIGKIQNIQKNKFILRIEKILKENNEKIIVKQHKDNKIYVSYELSDLIKIAYEKGILSKEEIKELINFNEGVDKLDIEKDYKIVRHSMGKKIYNFEYYEEKSPLFINMIDDYSFVEIILQHKQRAVGYQSMIYFCMYMSNVKDTMGACPVGRFSRCKEKISISITKEHLIGIVKSFIVASEDHSWDIKFILKEIING